MNRRVCVVLLVALFALPYVTGPDFDISDGSPDIPTEPNMREDFVLSGDGDESPASINDFSETLEDNVMFAPDAFPENTQLATAGSAGPSVLNTYLNTSTVNAVRYESYAIGAGLFQWLYLNFSHSYIPSTVIESGSIELVVFAFNIDDPVIQLYNFETDTWELNQTVIDDSSYNNHTMDLTNDHVSNGLTMFRWTGYSNDAVCKITVDYAISSFVPITVSSDAYLESFYDISDWTLGAGNAPTTDGDVMTWALPDDNMYDSIYVNSPSFTAAQCAGGLYYEFTIDRNASAGAPRVRVMAYSEDDIAGDSYEFIDFYPVDGWTTKKGIIQSDYAIESLRFYAKSTVQTEVYFDYFRISPANESGWQNDGSTVIGITDFNVDSLSSDGDVIHIVGTDASYCMIKWDRVSFISDTYYQFVELRFKAIIGHSLRFYFEDYDYGGDVNPQITYSASGDWETARVNIAALSDIDTVADFGIRDDTDGAQEFWIDWFKFYSIVNYSITQSSTTTDDYLYVDAGVLYSHVDDGYIEANHDPALSVSDTYPVYNLTTSSTAPEFSQYVSSWSSYSDDTRGATTSGTVTDIKLKFDSTEIISAIKFIEDSTAPEVVRSSSTPNDPEDDETITLSAVITDAVEVWKVYFDAIVYPAGFSDSAYYATEQSDNLWTYSFSTMISGYYCFKVQATDAANTNSLTEFAYIELTVREAAIIVEEITLIGAGEDFTMMTFSARINRDCTYTIYEESESSAEADTSTGSVTAPSFNLAWTKLDVEDSNVNFTITFVSGTLTYNYTSQYQVAQTTERIELTTYTLFGAGSDFTYMQYSGYISHDCTFTIEEWSDTWAMNETHSGSVSAGDFNIAWDKIGVSDINANYTITFTNGSLTLVITSGYQTAYKLLSITVTDCKNLESSDNWVTNITINFITNKAVDWYIYDVDNSDAVLGSGSSVEGTDSMTWVQNTARGAHQFAVKWTDGVSNEWYNGSYWVYDRNIDDLPGGGDLGADERRTIQMWATIAAVIGVIGVGCIGLVYFKFDEVNKLQLPNYPTQPSTREERRKQRSQ